MEYKQDSFGDILESEKLMFEEGGRYGEYFINACGFNEFLNSFIKSIDDPSKFIFIIFLSQVRNHLMLALLSCVRLHHTQTGMNLRQVYEAGAWASYAMAFAEENKFYLVDEKGAARTPAKLQDKRNSWLDANFKIPSDNIKNLKRLLNETVMHSNIVYSFQNFKLKSEGNPGFNTPFFDIEDEFRVKSDLWFIGNTALGLIDLFYGVNQKYKVFKLVDDFSERFKVLVDQNNKLKAEMTKNPRMNPTL